jgi:hypothetical protein
MPRDILTPDRLLTFAAGALATGAMVAVARAARSPVMSDLQDLAATIAAPPGSVLGETLGSAVQVINGGLFAQAYDGAFEALRVEPGWRTGLGLGIVHGLTAGLFLGVVPALHPRVPAELPPPGAFLRHRGLHAATTLVALHALFGAIVGSAIAVARGHGQSDD